LFEDFILYTNPDQDSGPSEREVVVKQQVIAIPRQGGDLIIPLILLLLSDISSYSCHLSITANSTHIPATRVRITQSPSCRSYFSKITT
jgi:hypothetical protein